MNEHRTVKTAGWPSFQSPHAGIAAPLYLGHFACFDIDFEWTAWLWEPILGQQNRVVTRLEGDAEMTFPICRECCDYSLIARDTERCVWKRRCIGNIGSGSNRSRTSWTNSNHSFDSGTAVRLDLAGGHASAGNKEREEEAQLCTCCHRIRFLKRHPAFIL